MRSLRCRHRLARAPFIEPAFVLLDCFVWRGVCSRIVGAPRNRPRQDACATAPPRCLALAQRLAPRISSAERSCCRPRLPSHSPRRPAAAATRGAWPVKDKSLGRLSGSVIAAATWPLGRCPTSAWAASSQLCRLRLFRPRRRRTHMTFLSLASRRLDVSPLFTPKEASRPRCARDNTPRPLCAGTQLRRGRELPWRTNALFGHVAVPTSRTGALVLHARKSCASKSAPRR